MYDISDVLARCLDMLEESNLSINDVVTAVLEGYERVDDDEELKELLYLAVALRQSSFR